MKNVHLWDQTTLNWPMPLRIFQYICSTPNRTELDIRRHFIDNRKQTILKAIQFLVANKFIYLQSVPGYELYTPVDRRGLSDSDVFDLVAQKLTVVDYRRTIVRRHVPHEQQITDIRIAIQPSKIIHNPFNNPIH